MGWVYNLDEPDPHDDISLIIGLCIAFSSAALLAVAARFHVRIWVKKNVWVDDYAALFSALLGMAYAGLAVAQTRWGLGLHSEYFPEANMKTFGKMQYAGGPIYTLAILGFKISLLASYLRIGGFVSSYRLVILAAIAACVANQVVFTIVLSVGCRPVAKQWDQSIPGTCINTVASYYALAGTSLIFDVIIIALPLPILARLKLKMRQKILLGVLFGLGFFVTIIQIIRIFTVANLETYANSEPIIIWSDVEISLGVIISCVPTYGPYFRAFKLNMSSYRRRATQGGSSGLGQTYGLSSRATNTHTGSHVHNITGTGTGTGGNLTRVFDSSTPVTGPVGVKKGWKGNESEESILARDSASLEAEAEAQAEAEIEMQGREIGRAVSSENGSGIRIATEVRVERGPGGEHHQIP
ncbi:hypothetical protein BDV18DRAFT_163903 [Aspergillus unguis]